MVQNDEDGSRTSDRIDIDKVVWYEEIIRETEHYYQAEALHDQRASWLLATSGVLVTVALGLGDSVAARLPSSLLALGIMSLVVSAFFAVISILPMRGIHRWRDYFGTSLRRDSRMEIEQLIEQRFRHGLEWSREKYELRLTYHFRSHYLRSNSKAVTVFWSGNLLLVGIVFFAASAVIVLLA